LFKAQLRNGVKTLLCPGGSTALIILRVLMGLGEGTTFPALSALLASWIPLTERSKLGSFVFGGGQV
jgi:ACS family sodium-dependent inorganic phosphate cotransporter